MQGTRTVEDFDQTAEFLAVFQANVRAVYEHQVDRIIQRGTDRLLGTSRRKYLRAHSCKSILRSPEAGDRRSKSGFAVDSLALLTIFLRRPTLTGRRCF